jgi:ribosomal protein S18 acetylase RimI-like enzyme
MTDTRSGPPAFTVRQAVLADLDAVAPLFDRYRQFYEQASDLAGAGDFLRQRMANGESVIFLAEQAGQALGFTQLYPSFSSISMARELILYDLFVAEAGRQRGIGKALLDAAVAYGKAIGAASMNLTTAHTNTTAQALYHANGWQAEEVYRQYNMPLVQPV